MALRKKGKYHYGDSQEDIQAELLRYSKLNGYPAAHYAEAICACGGKVFRLLLDENEGVAVRVCSNCRFEHPMGDSEEYLEDAELEECQCHCGSGELEITAGVALYHGTEDVKWLYIGCRCPQCGLTACYGDWKNEFNGFQEFLRLI